MKILFILLLLPLLQVHAREVYDLSLLKKSAVPNILMPFESDACSVIAEGPDKDPTKWQDCCVEHDFKYWIGGTEKDRLAADKEFLGCLKSKTSPVWARLVYMGVRVGGTPHASTTYRWGFGWTQLRGYQPFTESELIQIKEKSLLVQNKSDHVNLSPKNHLQDPQFLSKNFCEERVLKYFAENTNYSKVLFYSRSISDEMTYVLRPIDINCTYRIVMSSQVDEAFCSRYENIYVKDKIISRITHAGCK